MQFVAHGPDIPDALLQAHEDGRVVFFCGSGIGYPAGLPDFKGLVEQIYTIVGDVQLPIEKKAFKHKQYDTTLDLLERRLPGKRREMRQALADALRPKLDNEGALATHKALLQLAHNREGTLRLVTTNFDRVFHAAADHMGQSIQFYAAPMLPVPKKSRWNGLVYLHGLLPESIDDTALNQLVVTSGDFGLAYLTEQWAARFVSELFRNYVVCFIGYSINDPILRYMRDALAADRMLGENTPQAWALGSCPPENENDYITECEAKGVTPILYSDAYNHAALHDTLQKWAEIYRDGTLGKAQIITAHANARPTESTLQDNFIGRMLWALSDQSGLPAKRFAELNPAPPLEWLLDVFCKENYLHEDLFRFGVPPHAKVDAKLRFSFVRRPTPYHLAPAMSLSVAGDRAHMWDNIMFHMAGWLVRHLNDPRLILWTAQRGGQPHPRWRMLIEDWLNELARYETEGNAEKLHEIRNNAPNGIPEPFMRTLWGLLLSGQVRGEGAYFEPWPNIYCWLDRFKHTGLTTALRLELRALLAPKVVLKRRFRWPEESTDSVPSRQQQLVNCELALASDHVHSAFQDKTDKWNAALPLLIEDLQQSLRDALDLLQDIGQGDARSDRSFLDLPSITPHWQNHDFHDWTILIEMLRDAWLEVHSNDVEQATRIAQAWFELPYLTFKRLALFAASHDVSITSGQWTDWLLDDEPCWLWALVTMREVCRLLVLQGNKLTSSEQERLEAAILKGPLHIMRQDCSDQDELQYRCEKHIWLRLAKLESSGLVLGSDAAARLTELSQKHTEWTFNSYEREEFSIWMSGTGSPDFEENRRIDIIPHKRNEIVLWFKVFQPKIEPGPENNWRDICKKHPLHSLAALYDLAQEEIWPSGEYWSDALYAWSQGRRAMWTWRYGAQLVQTMPDSVLHKNVHAVSWWVKAVSQSNIQHEEVLFEIIGRIIDAPDDKCSVSRQAEPITDAINNPIGRATESLLIMWFKRQPKDNEGLPSAINSFFTKLCDINVEQFRHGRVLLASHAVALYRVDSAWTEQNLLPLFDWKDNPIEASFAWGGFLWSPRLYQPLLVSIKPSFLENAKRYSELDESSAQQYAALLTHAALRNTEGYAVEDFQNAIAVLPPEGLEMSAQALTLSLENAGEQRGEFWNNRVLPFWKNIWPKRADRATPAMAELFARLSIAADSDFPAALATIDGWLKPFEYPRGVIKSLYSSGLCSRFPQEALCLLAEIVENQLWIQKELKECLDSIVEANPELTNDVRYRRLSEYSRK